MTLSKKYVYHYFMKIHSDAPPVSTSNNNVTAELVSKLFTPKRLSTPIATGKAPGYTLDAAYQILNRLGINWTIENVTSSDLTSPVPDPLSTKDIIIRTGSYSPHPDSHPLVIKTFFGNFIFELAFMVYGVRLRRTGEGHAVVAYICGGRRYIYDSNQDRRLEVNWSDPNNRKRILKYSNATDFIDGVMYTLYIRT
jgi:hypothetical protein